MYSIKIGRDGRGFQVFPCGHYTVTYVHAGSQAIERGLEPGEGIRVDLSNPTRSLRLPEDGHVMYVMNEKGDTVDTYRYPPSPQGKGEAKEAS